MLPLLVTLLSTLIVPPLKRKALEREDSGGVPRDIQATTEEGRPAREAQQRKLRPFRHRLLHLPARPRQQWGWQISDGCVGLSLSRSSRPLDAVLCERRMTAKPVSVQFQGGYGFLLQ
ncbi:hypothetical protein K443DRAFT_368200 [Laccaria amethystina LaAM-08-1]|uniref:Uncharacterized protein n=1 Tax=Laccaria amethystina LaAM-08-1 TaxID=1095629 RepID=A0A0C9Y504_9AGAR|nr:hypothetical protein K443DRAFT_368200 [Laccaria amethystina LaAM-08-1]